MISVLMTTTAYDDSEALTRAIESVIAQDISDFELIIYHDGNATDIAELLDRFSQEDSRMQVIGDGQSVDSVALTLGRCLQASSADREYLALMHEDVLMKSTTLRVLQEDLEHDSKVDAVVAPIRGGQEDVEIALSFESSVILLRKEFISRCGWFDASIVLREHAAWEFYSRMTSYGSCKMASGFLCRAIVEHVTPVRLRQGPSEFVKKYIHFRDSQGWEVTLDAALTHPRDRIPVAMQGESWTQQELEELYHKLLVYYCSVGQWSKASEWAEVLSNALSVSQDRMQGMTNVLAGLTRDCQYEITQSTMMLGWYTAYTNHRQHEASLREELAQVTSQLAEVQQYSSQMQGLHREAMQQQEANIHAQGEAIAARDLRIHDLQRTIEAQHVELCSLRHRIVNQLNAVIKQIPFVHQISKCLIGFFMSPFQRKYEHAS